MKINYPGYSSSVPLVLWSDLGLLFAEWDLGIVLEAFLALSAQGPDNHSAEQGDVHDQIDEVIDGIDGWTQLTFLAPLLGRFVRIGRGTIGESAFSHRLFLHGEEPTFQKSPD